MASVKWFTAAGLTASVKLSTWPEWGTVRFLNGTAAGDWSVGDTSTIIQHNDWIVCTETGTTNTARTRWCLNGSEVDLTWGDMFVEDTCFRTHYPDTAWVRITQRGVQVSQEDMQAYREADAKRRIREIIQSRQAPMIITRRKGLSESVDVREQRARETLRRIIGDSGYRNFLRTGFVTAKSKREGLTYQIFPGGTFTNVYQGGKQVERLCVVLKGNFPPTDSLIVRYLMIMNNPKQFRDLAVKHTTYRDQVRPLRVDDRRLADIYSDLKSGRRRAV